MKKIDVNKTPAIAISGKMGYGKDYFGNLIENKYRNVKRIAFADSVKEEIDFIIKVIFTTNTKPEDLANTMGVTTEEILKFYVDCYKSDIKWPELSTKNKNDTIRGFLQYWGTEVWRNKDINHWVNKTKYKIKELNKDGYVALVTDGRFPNEINMINEIGGKTIRIKISEETQLKRLMERDGVLPTDEQLKHESEVSLDEYKNFTLIIEPEVITNETIMNIIDDNLMVD